MDCPFCQNPNQPDAPFCVECGESLIVGNAAEGGAATISARLDRDASTAPFILAADGRIMPVQSPCPRRLSIRLALAFLFLALLLNLMAQTSQANASRYNQGLVAVRQQQWHRAAILLGPLADQGYDQASDLYRNAVSQVATWNRYHQLAANAEGAGATTQASFYYQQASQLEPGYGDTTAKLTALRARVGQVIYLMPDGLYLAAADGEPGSRLPGNGNSAQVLTTSADGALVCYVFNSGSGSVQMRNLVVGDIDRQYYTEQTFLFDHPIAPQPLDAAFVNNGAGLLFVVGGTLGEIAATPVELYYLDLAGDTGLREIGLASLVARPNPGDTSIYFVPAGDASAIALYDTKAELVAGLVEASSPIASLAVSPPDSGQESDDAANLFFATVSSGNARFYSLPLPDGAVAQLLDVPILAASPPSVRISPSPIAPMAIATIVGGNQVWRLNAATATLHSDKWGNSIGAIGDVKYSPDGNRILVTSLPSDAANLAPYLILDGLGQTQLSRGSFDNPATEVGWLADSRRFYVYAHDPRPAPLATSDECRISFQSCSRDEVEVINSDGGTIYGFHLGQPDKRRPSSLFSLMPDAKTLIYIVNGASVSALDGQMPTWAMPSAIGVWSLPIR